MAPVEREIRRDIESKQLWALEIFQREMAALDPSLLRPRFRGTSTG